jgi:adenine-specific DNA-methyltransferase
MDEVFGPENFVAQLVWEKGRKNDAKLVSVGHEYILVYLRNKNFMKEANIVWREAKPGAAEIQAEYLRLRKQHGKDNKAVEQGIREFYEKLPKTHPSKKHARYGRVDDNGVWRDDNMSWPGGGGPKYAVVHPVTGKPCAVPEGGWRYSTPEKMNEMIRQGKVVFREDHTEPPIRKTYLVRGNSDDELDDDEDIGIQVAGSYFYRSALQASNELTALIGKKVFENPKDHQVLARWVSYVGSPNKDDIVLDFFSGSCTTAQAVMELNKNDGGSRQVICVQLPEPCEEESVAYKAGFNTVAEISRERFRRVIGAIRQSSDLVTKAPENLGFKSFLLTPSNFKQWRGDGIDTPEQLAEQIEMFAKSEKEGAQVEDMLYELLLKFGQELTTLIETLEIEGGKVFAIHGRNMLFLLEDFTEAMIQPLVDLKPREIIAIDGVFQDSDTLKTNLDLQCRDASIKFTCL